MQKQFFLLITLLILNASNLIANDYKVTAKTLNIRDCPNTTCNKIGTLHKNDNVVLLNYVENDTWAQVEYMGQTGYVSSKYLKESYSTPFDKSSANSDWLIFILASIVLFPIFLLLILQRNAKRVFGATLCLLSSLAFIFGGSILNMMVATSMANLTSSGTGSFAFAGLVTIVSYVFFITTAVLAIIGFFKNTGIALIVLSILLVVFGVASNGYVIVLLGGLSFMGGIGIITGIKQISNIKTTEN